MRLRHTPEALAARIDPAESLARSAAIFRAHGMDYSADFSEMMAADATQEPALYVDWADAQSARATKLAHLTNPHLGEE